jgi:ferritin-like metal-binding protein YciE
MIKITDAQSALITKLQALYYTESQLEKALPKLEKAVSDSMLKEGIRNHLKETKEHSRRLEKVFKLLERKPRKLTTEGIRGIIEDAEWVLKVHAPAEVKDAMIAGAARYAEHYEMAGYMSAIEQARILGLKDVVSLLRETYREEYRTDKELAAALMMNTKK